MNYLAIGNSVDFLMIEVEVSVQVQKNERSDHINCKENDL